MCYTNAGHDNRRPETTCEGSKTTCWKRGMNRLIKVIQLYELDIYILVHIIVMLHVSMPGGR